MWSSEGRGERARERERERKRARKNGKEREDTRDERCKSQSAIRGIRYRDNLSLSCVSVCWCSSGIRTEQRQHRVTSTHKHKDSHIDTQWRLRRARAGTDKHTEGLSHSLALIGFPFRERASTGVSHSNIHSSCTYSRAAADFSRGREPTWCCIS